MSSKRKPQNKIKLTEDERLQPIDVEIFGSPNDPCFGKLFDLSTPECKRCGDSDICAIVSSQKLKVKREVIESNNRFKDLEDAMTKEELVKSLSKKYTKVKLKKVIADRLNIDLKEARNLINKVNGK